MSIVNKIYEKFKIQENIAHTQWMKKKCKDRNSLWGAKMLDLTKKIQSSF